VTYRPDSDVQYIVVHYSATPVESDFTADDIDRMHRARGFYKIGYHKFICKDGTVEDGRDLSKRGQFEQGAHVKGHNHHSIGICFEGGVHRSNPNKGMDTRTPEQIAAMVKLIDALLKRYPRAQVVGHRDMPGAATQCPGFNAGVWWDEVIAQRKADPLGEFFAALIGVFSGLFGGRK